MTLRWIAVPTALSLALISPAAPSAAAAQGSRPDPAGFTIPLQVSVPGQGSFSGALRLLAFRAEGGQLVAVGLLSGSRVDEAGTASSIVRTVKLPASTAAPPPDDPPAPAPSPEPPPAPEPEPSPGASDEAPSAPPVAAAPTAPATCQALRVELGPLEADVLGTAIRVDRVLLEVDPVTRGTVGVLCGSAGAPDAPRELARKLNRLIGALT
jgi:hypothetical protein